MMCNFDELINRSDTNCVKYDGVLRFFKQDELFPMWVADMDFAVSPAILEALHQKLDQRILGYEELSESYFNAIIDWYQRKNITLDKQHIVFSAGVVTSLAMSVLALTNYEDSIVIQSPVYYPFYSVVCDNNRHLIVNNLVENNGYYRIDLEALASQISSSTKMLFLCSPHNPVGRVWTYDELLRIVQFAKQFNLIIVSDEIHSDLSFERFTSMLEFSEFYSNIIVLNSPSKAFNLAGLQSSYIISYNEKLLLKLKKSLKSLGLGGGNNLAYISTIEAYKQKLWLEQLKTYIYTNHLMVENMLREANSKIKVKVPEATYLMWLDFRDCGFEHEIIVKKLLHEAKLALNDGSSFGDNAKGFMRLNIALPQKVLKEKLTILINCFA